MRIVLDTNALLRCLSSKSKYAVVLDRLYEGEFSLYYTHEIILEYEEKITHFFSREVVELILSSFNLLSNVHKIDVYFQMNLISKDKDDNKFSDCAFAANVHYIVTNDKHFDQLKEIEFPQIKTITLEEFYEIIK